MLEKHQLHTTNWTQASAENPFSGYKVPIMYTFFYYHFYFFVFLPKLGTKKKLAGFNESMLHFISSSQIWSFGKTEQNFETALMFSILWRAGYQFFYY